jgi:hypothetical protein
MLHRFLPLALLVSGVAFIAPVTGQPPLPPALPPPPPLPPRPPEAMATLQKLTGAKGAELEQAIRGVAVYPARTRAAILDLASYAQKHPALLADLAKLRGGPAAAIDRYLTSNKYEPELQQAAALVLVEAPEAVERMQERPEMVKIVGVAWSTPPGRDVITAVLNAAAAGQEKRRDAAADRWASRLKADPKLMDQYTQLLDDYTRKTTADDQQPDDTWESYNYGTYKTKDGYVVNDVPSPEVVNYALAVASQYPQVATAIIQQFLGGQNQDDFNAAVGGWYSANGGSIPQSDRQDNSDYYDLLKELAALADALAGSGSGSNPGTSSGSNSGSDPGTSSGSNSGSNPGTSSGSNSGSNPGTSSGNSSGSNPGTSSGSNPGTSSGSSSGSNPGTSSGSGSGDTSGTSSGNSGNFSGNTFDGKAVNSFLGANARDYPKLTDWTRKNPQPKLGSPTDLARFKDAPGHPGKSAPNKGPSAAPFSDRLKATPPAERARPMPHMGQNPFNIARKPTIKPGTGKPVGPPRQVMRGAPSMSHQLTRAPSQMRAAWQPRGGGHRPPGGVPRPRR